jgi:hypothetical protein
MTKRIAVADTDALIDACYPVMAELRPKISRDEFLPFVKRLAAHQGFKLAFLAEAVRLGCRQVRLVSNVRRLDAHRFYARKGMTHEAHYFSINVPGAA